MSATNSRRYVIILTTVFCLAACGRAPLSTDGTGGTTASATRSDSPATAPSPTPAVPDGRMLTATNCSAAAPLTAPKVLGPYYTIGIAPNWLDTGDYAHTETLLLELTAPATYGNSPTKLQFESDLGPVHTVYGTGATAHAIAQKHADSIASETAPNSVAGVVTDCKIGSEDAAAFGFSNRGNLGYWVYFVHHDRLFQVILFGAAGVGNQATQD